MELQKHGFGQQAMGGGSSATSKAKVGMNNYSSSLSLVFHFLIVFSLN